MTQHLRTSSVFVFGALFAAILAITGTVSTGTADTGTAGVAPAFTRTVSKAQTAAPQNSRVQTIQFTSTLVGKTLPYNVLLPADYDQPAAKTKRYPVLYLLHGLTGHYTDWLGRTRLAEYAKPYELIIVTPEGHDSWYTDSVTVPTDKYESYLLQELIPDVQRRYRTIEAREGRAIAGLSMGGYGALKSGVKHPEMFAFAGSLSGALGAASWTESDLRGRGVVLPSLKAVFGPEDSPTRRENDLHKLYRDLTPERVASLPYIYLDCGTEDLLLPTNRSLVDILLAQKIPHEYRQLPGKHNWEYWDAQVQEVLRIAARTVSKPTTAAPKSSAMNAEREMVMLGLERLWRVAGETPALPVMVKFKLRTNS